MPATRAEHPPPPPDPGWHARSAGEALAALGTVREGLDPDEAERRLREHGPNRMPANRGRRPSSATWWTPR